MQPADTDARHLPASTTATTPPTNPDSVGDLLGAWQTTEVALARRFPECRDLPSERVEDLYQDTALALLNRPFQSEEHLRNALRLGIRQRARNHHRDAKRHAAILHSNAPAIQRLAEANGALTEPEQSLIAEQDRLIAVEFLAELDPLERNVFALKAERLQYRAIAATLGIPVNEARNAARSCERKRERFQLLYDTGRLCGYRASTIQAFAEGTASQDVEIQARAHLHACPHCRATATRPGSRLTQRVAALLPLPLLLRHPLRRLSARFTPNPASSSTSLLAGTAGTKLGLAAALLTAVTATAALHTITAQHRDTPRPTAEQALPHNPIKRPIPATHDPVPALSKHPGITQRRDTNLPRPQKRPRVVHRPRSAIAPQPRKTTLQLPPSRPPTPPIHAEGSNAMLEFGPEQP